MKFNRYALSDLATIKYGKNQKKVLSESGNIPIYGTGGLMGYATTALYDKPSVLIGRKGTIGKVKYVEHPFWTVDTLFYTIVNTDIVLPKYLYYVMSLVDLNNYNEGTTIPSLRTETLNRLEFDIPSLVEQETILSCLNPIDEKIALNNAINNNLYEQMLSIFNNARRTSAWNKHKLSDVLIFFDNLRKPLSSIQREKMAHIYPYYGAASIVDYVEDYLFDGTYILISEDGANVIDSFGHPLTQYTYGKFWVNNHAHIVKGTNGYSEALVYAMLGTLNMQSIVTGAAQPKINQANLRNFEAVLPESEEAQVLSELLNPMLQQILHHEQENEKLSELRDILLPRLMSGALDISAIDL